MQNPTEVSVARAKIGVLSDDEVAACLGISLKTLQNRRSKGDAPPACKVGRDNVTLLSDLKTWVARRRTGCKVAA